MIKNSNIVSLLGQDIVVFKEGEAKVIKATKSAFPVLIDMPDYRTAGQIDGIEILDVEPGVSGSTEIDHLPEPVEGVYCLVYKEVSMRAAMNGRPTDDLLIPWNIFYSNDGRTCACTALAVFR